MIGIFDFLKKGDKKNGLTDEEIASKVTEKEFQMLLQLHMAKLQGGIFAREIPPTEENLEAMRNLEGYGLISIAHDLVITQPGEKPVAYITQKGSSMVDKISPRFIKGYKPKKTHK